MEQELYPVSEVIPKMLAAAGVKVIFGFPGETSLPLYMGLQKNTDIRHVLARCPRCAGFMADGYARVSGTLGVCDAPGGIGSPYLAPALHEAKNSSIPLLCIASGVARTKRGKWTTSECDQQSLFAPLTKATMLLDVPDQLLDSIGNALYSATSPRTGPVFLEIPADVFGVPYAMAEYMLRSLPNVDFPALRPYPDKEVLSQVAYAIGEAQSPVIVAGGGIHLGSAVQALQELARECGIPVATTLNGKGAINESSPLSLGVTGSKGNLEANKFVQDADCVIVIGSKLGDKSTNGYAWPTRDQMVIHVDSDPHEFHHVHARYIPVLSDARAFCQLLLPRLQGAQRQTTLLPPNKPFWEIGATDHLCNLLSQTLPQDAVVVADASVSSGWAGAAIRLHAPGQRLITPRGSGSIGFALPAAIGAQFARPSAQVVAIGGDGGFAMAMHEMETATRYNLPILYFLLNNQRLGLIDKHATALLGGAAVSENFFDIDWIQAGRAFGWTTIRIETAQQLSDAWPGLFPTRKPTLVDFRISAEEMAPDFFITLNKKRS